MKTKSKPKAAETSKTRCSSRVTSINTKTSSSDFVSLDGDSNQNVSENIEGSKDHKEEREENLVMSDFGDSIAEGIREAPS